MAARGATVEATSELRRAAKLRKAAGRPPISLMMNLKTAGDDGFRAAQRHEAAAFADACGVATLEGHQIAAQLRAALKAVRRLENSAVWIANSLVESVALFGLFA